MNLSEKAKRRLIVAIAREQEAQEIIDAIESDSGGGGGTDILPSANQMVYVNGLAGNDTTGDGSYNKPFASVIKAMTTITDATQTKPYVISLQAGRQIETGDLLIKPYVFIVGAMQRATYLRVNGGSIKPHSSHSSGSSWVGLKNLYLGGSTVINWDLQAIGGNNCIMVIEDCTVTGAFTYKGRNAGGGDYLEWYGGIMLGTLTLDTVLAQLQGGVYTAATTMTNTQGLSFLASSIVNCAFYSGLNCSIQTIELTNVSYPNSSSNLTTTGTVAISSYRGMPPVSRQTLSGGTTVDNLDT